MPKKAKKLNSLVVEWRDPKTLTPHPNNARIHPKSQVMREIANHVKTYILQGEERHAA